ncbi:hypothetical protein VNI00_010670 [Paramarasmius palmivorus]|uniref:Uncharacterized protein n=1 Tax=Paramarasmius palmivorus TaxID=297713 RepID=A0AAW0CJ59_9AGAR
MALTDSEFAAPYIVREVVITYPIATLSTMFYVYAANIVQAVHQVRQASIDFDAAKTREWDPLIQYLAKDTFKTAYIVLLQVLPLLLVVLATIFAAAVMEGVGIYNSKDKWRWALFDTAALISYGGWNTSAGLNFVLTALTAGRIWWISRQARHILSRADNQQYRAIIAIILESGLIYPVLQIIYIVTLRILDPERIGNIPVDLFPVVYQTAGIAPTLIIVRAATGKAIESVNQEVSTLRFGEMLGKSAHDSDLHALDLPSEGDTAAMQSGEAAGADIEKNASRNRIA